MHSILMMAVLSGSSTAPGQYVYFGPCGSFYATPVVAYYPVERAAGGAETSGSGRKAVQQKLEDLAAMIDRISRGLEKAEDRFQAMEEKRRDQARALELKKLVEAAVAGVESAGSGQQATLRKLEDLAALIALITRRLEKGEDRLQATEEKQRDRILALERKLEEQAKQQHKAMEEHAKQQHKAMEELAKQQHKSMEEQAKQQHKSMEELAALVALITRRLEKGRRSPPGHTGKTARSDSGPGAENGGTGQATAQGHGGPDQGGADAGGTASRKGKKPFPGIQRQAHGPG